MKFRLLTKEEHQAWGARDYYEVGFLAELSSLDGYHPAHNWRQPRFDSLTAVPLGWEFEHIACVPWSAMCKRVYYKRIE